MDVIRFRQSGSFVHCEGLLHLKGDRLEIEYQMADGLFGVIKSGVKKASIPLASLASAELKESWIGDSRMVLQSRTMEAVADVPGMSRGRIEFQVDRSDRDLAKQLVEGLVKPDGPRATGLED